MFVCLFVFFSWCYYFLHEKEGTGMVWCGVISKRKKEKKKGRKKQLMCFIGDEI